MLKLRAEALSVRRTTLAKHADGAFMESCNAQVAQFRALRSRAVEDYLSLGKVRFEGLAAFPNAFEEMMLSPLR